MAFLKVVYKQTNSLGTVGIKLRKLKFVYIDKILCNQYNIPCKIDKLNNRLSARLTRDNREQSENL